MTTQSSMEAQKESTAINPKIESESTATKTKITVGMRFTIDSLPNDSFTVVKISKNEENFLNDGILIKSESYGFTQIATKNGMQACLAKGIWKILS